MAVEPLILLNGTTADANQVMALFNEIYTNIDETNVALANKTGTGRFVLQDGPTINGATFVGVTLNSPIINGTVTGSATYNVITLLTPVFSGAPTGNVTGTGTVVLQTTPTILTPIIASFINSLHNHENNVGGGQLNASNVFSAGLVPVNRGGTGAGTFAIHGVLLGNTTGAFSVTTAGTTGQVLRGQTGADPIFGQVVLTTDVTGILPFANGGTGATTAYTAGSVIFSNGTGFAQDNANFFWNDSTNRLGINTNAPAFPLDVVGQINGTSVSGNYFDGNTSAAYGAGRYSLSNSTEVGLDADITVGGVPTINSSYNVASISNITVVLGAGGESDTYQFRVNFSTALASTNYFVGTTGGPIVQTGTSNAIPVGIVSKTTTYVELVLCGESAGIFPRVGHIDLIIVGGN